MPEEWERVRPSWKRVHKNKKELKPQVTLTRVADKTNRRGYDRIGLNQAAISRIGLTTSSSCNLLIQRQSRQIAIKIISLFEKPDADSFFLSISKKAGSIRKAGLFDLLDIPPKIVDNLQKAPFRTELRAEEGLYIFKLPDKEIGQPFEERIEVLDNEGLEIMLSDGL